MYNKAMKKIYVSARANRVLIDYLAGTDCQVCMVPPLPQLEHAIADHPDLVFCSLGPDKPLFQGRIDRLASGYPKDVPYNACCTGRFFIHNLKYTAPELLDAAKSAGLTFVDVRQGYSRCSCLPVTEDAVITADRGMAEACRKAGLHVLLVSPGHVELPGYDYGFIGGCSGRVGDTVVFHGNLGGHPDGTEIRKFIEERGLAIVDFPEFPLRDIGSIIEDSFSEESEL